MTDTMTAPASAAAACSGVAPFVLSELLARRLCESKLLGYFRAKPYMRERGIPMRIIEDALAEYADSAPERAAQLAEKKYMKYFDPSDRAMMQKLKNALVRSGYGFRDIAEAVELLKEEHSEE